uniref:Peptidase A2 domain-containing protein n=1 Tax=Trichogramma kaykai TaxID=54128 RepID=A0ABD2XQJ7_9HYME
MSINFESSKTFQRVGAINPFNWRFCYNCKKPGKLNGDIKTPRQKAICRRCRYEGLIARYDHSYAQKNLNENVGCQPKAQPLRDQNRDSVLIKQPPIMSVTNRHLKMGRGIFLIDTGSDLNVIKRASLVENITINHRIIYHMQGIGYGSVATCGRIILKFFDKPCHLDLVQDNFPFEYDGILGMEFLRTQNAVFYLLLRTGSSLGTNLSGSCLLYRYQRGKQYVPGIKARPGISTMTKKLSASPS